MKQTLTIYGHERDWNTELEMFIPLDKYPCGMKATVIYTDNSLYAESGIKSQVFRNLTEFHHNYQGEGSSAFESNIHMTGQTERHTEVQSITIELEDKIEERF